jgi:hypothetical protein
MNKAQLTHYPRMADYARWITQCEPALGYETGTLVAVFEERSEADQADILLGDEVGAALLHLLEGLYKYKEEDGEVYSTTPQDLLSKLAFHGTPGKTWPRTPRGLTSRLERLVQPLRKRGIEFVRSRGRDRLITFYIIDDDKFCMDEEEDVVDEDGDVDGETTDAWDRYT